MRTYLKKALEKPKDDIFVAREILGNTSDESWTGLRLRFGMLST